MADILWICNRQRCEDCFEECRHTSDREFAVNPEFDRNRFEEDQDGNLWEDGVGHGKGIRTELLQFEGMARLQE